MHAQPTKQYAYQSEFQFYPLGQIGGGGGGGRELQKNSQNICNSAS